MAAVSPEADDCGWNLPLVMVSYVWACMSGGLQGILMA